MADNVAITPGSGKIVLADEVNHPDFGTGVFQGVKIYDATTGGVLPLVVSANGAQVDVSASSGVGSLTETAPATDTASSGLNGRLQRIAQRITSLIALLPTTLTGSGNFKVAVVESTASQAVTGTVTANAGTNLNTSALALEAGHLATIDSTLTEIGADIDAIETSTGNIPAQGQAAMVASMPVAIASNQSTLPVSQNAATMPSSTTLQNNASASGNGTNMTVAGYAVVILNVVSSTPMSGGTTVNFEASVDNTTWVSILGHQIGVPGNLATTTTSDGDFRITVAGYTYLRARISAYSAGVTTIKGYATPVTGVGTAVSVDSGSGAGSAIGVTTGAAVITDSNGTLQQYLRGIVKLIAAKIGVTIADGDNATFGAKADAAVTDSTTTNTHMSFLKGIVKELTDIWDSTNHWFNFRRVKKDTFATSAFTITLASLASSTSGVGRQSTMISNTSPGVESALITVKFTVGTTPTANTVISVYLLRGDGTITDDNAGASDAGLTVINAPLLGQILCSAATSNVAYYGVFDTKALGSLGPNFGIAIVNGTGVTANATGGNFAAQYTLMS